MAKFYATVEVEELFGYDLSRDEEVFTLLINGSTHPFRVKVEQALYKKGFIKDPFNGERFLKEDNEECGRIQTIWKSVTLTVSPEEKDVSSSEEETLDYLRRL